MRAVIAAVLAGAAVAVGSPVQCGQSCKVNTDCAATGASVCGLCMPMVGGFRCASGCGMQCTADSDCGDLNCGHCDRNTRQCGAKPPPTPAPTPVPTTVGCGFHCTVNTDCVGECGLCFVNNVTKVGTCGTGCGMSCTADEHCLDSNCGSCNKTAGVCQFKAPTPVPTPAPTTVGCGFHCTVNTDCAGECELCFMNNVTKIGMCGTGCGMPCTADEHCLDSNCGSCNVTAGVCQHKAAAKSLYWF